MRSRLEKVRWTRRERSEAFESVGAACGSRVARPSSQEISLGMDEWDQSSQCAVLVCLLRRFRG